MELQTQYATALLMGMAGAILGAIHDVYRTSLREWRFLQKFSPLFDLAFWLFALIFVFTLLLGVNDGDVRLVIFVLLGIGYTLYYYTAHPLVVASTQFVVRLVYTVIRMLVRVFITVFVIPVVWLWKVFWTCVRVIDQVLSRMEPILVWPIWQMGRLLFKMIRPIFRLQKELRLWLSKKYNALLIRLLEKLRPTPSDDASDQPDPPLETEDLESVEAKSVGLGGWRFWLPWVRNRTKRNTFKR